MAHRCFLSAVVFLALTAGTRGMRFNHKDPKGSVLKPAGTCGICGSGLDFKPEHVLQSLEGVQFTCQQAQEWIHANVSNSEECEQAQQFFVSSCCEETLTTETCKICPPGLDFKPDLVLESNEGDRYTCQQVQDHIRSNGTVPCDDARLFFKRSCCEDATCARAYRPLVRRLDVQGMFTAASDWDYTWSLMFAGKSGSYKRQWDDAASKKLVLPDATDNFTLTWGDLLPDDEGYTYERERLKTLGRLSERDGYLVNESTVRGVCDLSFNTLKWLTRQPKVLGKLWLSLPGLGCVNTTLKKLGVDVREAIERECFSDCESTITSKFDLWNLTCDQLAESFRHKNETMSQQFLQLLMNESEQCLATPPDTLENLINHAISKRCLEWHPPRFLWQPDFKEPGEVTQTQFTGVLTPIGGQLLKGLADFGEVGALFGEAANGIGQAIGGAVDTVDSQKNPPGQVCKMPEEHIDSGRKEYIQQNGTCPEGTKCKCPQTSIFPRQTTSEIIGSGESIFVASGVASVASLTSQLASGFLMTTAFSAASLGLTAGLYATVAAPLFLFRSVGNFGARVLIDWATFECRSTLGCWPQQPDSVRVDTTPDACRLPSKASEGGSPLWFLPPPMLRMKHSKGSCILDNCEIDDYLNQTVGLGRSPNDWRYRGKPNIYNCQPLTFEAMTPPQRTNFLYKLKDSGIESEYSLKAAEEYLLHYADPSPHITDLKPTEPPEKES